MPEKRLERTREAYRENVIDRTAFSWQAYPPGSKEIPDPRVVRILNEDLFKTMKQ